MSSIAYTDEVTRWGDWGTQTLIPPQRCYMSHQALIVGDCKIYGGSCSDPLIKDADVYVGFDSSMVSTIRQYPWEEGAEFLYRITDMCAPSDYKSFTKLIDFLMKVLLDNKKVHCGCIGGHGRTGTVFAALIKAATNEIDAITFVREHYCKKAVESEAQVDFLHKHFGIKKVEGYKERASQRGLPGGKILTPPHGYTSWGSPIHSGGYKEAPKVPIASRVGFQECHDIQPARNDKISVWGSNVLFDKLVNSGTISI